MNAGDEFVGEAVAPVKGTMDTRGMTRGEPGIPAAFTWRGRQYAVAAMLERWKTTGDCTSGSGEQYVRKHWFRIRTRSGDEMTLYFERQSRSSRERKKRWWLYSIRPAGESP